MSQICQFLDAAIFIKRLIPDAGINVVPDVSGNVNVLGGANITTTGTANTITIDLDGTIVVTNITADNFYTSNVAAGLTINGDTILADGTDANIDINITPQGTGVLATTELTLTTDLAVQYGGTGASTFTDHGVLVGAAAAAITALAVGTNGQVLVGAAGADPIFANIGSTDGTITVTEGAGTLVLEGTDATTIQDGVVELATNAEAIAGTDTVRAIVPTSLKAKLGAQTSHGLPYGAGTDTAIAWTAEPSNGQILIGDTGNVPALGTLTAGTGIDITNAAHAITVGIEANTYTTAVDGWNGSILEQIDIAVTSDGAVITFSVEQNGGGDLTVVFSDGFYAWDTSPADTIALTAGTDIAPQMNYVYLLQTTKALTVSTVGWPATEHARLGMILCQSAASLQPDGGYKVDEWKDDVYESNNQGHIPHINYWIRGQHATWQSGVAPTLTITPQGVAADDVIFTNAQGIVLHLHDHTFPAFAGTPDVYTVNDSVALYNKITNLNVLLTDSAGVSMSGKRFSLVIWGVVNESTGDCKLMVNLPSGSYNNDAALLVDANKYADFSIPTDFRGVGFLIAQYNLHHSVAASGTWTEVSAVDLRGLYPSLAAGGTTVLPTEFNDNEFRILDQTDTTKELAFEVSGVTTGTTRTITMDDRNIDLDAVPDTVNADGGSATPAAGAFTIAGGTNITSAGAGSTVTVNLDGTITLTTVNATTFDTNVAAAGVTLAGTSLLADGTDANIDINITSKGTGHVIIDDLQLTTDLAVSEGGTGASSFTDHGLLVGAAAVTFTALAVGATNQVLLGATGADPVWGAVDLSTDITGVLPIANGGTNANAMTTTYGVNYFDGTRLVTTAVGTATHILTSNGVGVAPTFQAASGINTVYHTDGTDATESGDAITIAGGTNITTAGAGATVTINLDATITLTTVNATTFDTNVAAAGVTLSGTSLLADGTDANIDINITAKGTGQVIIDDLQLTTDLAVSEGGTGSSSFTDHGILVGAAAATFTALGVGATNQVLLGATGADPVWGAVDLTTDITGTLPVGNGGTGLTAPTDHSVLVGSGAGNITPITVGTDGQVLVGDTANDPVFATLTSTGTIAFTTGAGTLALNCRAATDALTGVVELATDAESIAGAASTVINCTSLKAKLGTQTDHGLLVGSGTAGAVTALTVGTDGQILVGDSADDPVFANITAGTGITITEGAGTLGIASAGTTMNNQTGTTYTLVIGDSQKMISCTNAAAITVTVPTNAAVAFPIGTCIGFFQGGAGQITLSGAVPPTLKSADDAYTTVKLYSCCGITKIDTDVWCVYGDVEA